MIRNGEHFEIDDRKLQIGTKLILLPRDEDDRADFLRAIALICSTEMGDSLCDTEGEPIDWQTFWDDGN